MIVTCISTTSFFFNSLELDTEVIKLIWFWIQILTQAFIFKPIWHTQFNPLSNSTTFPEPEHSFSEDVSRVPAEDLAVEDASTGQLPLHDAAASLNDD